jgi:hypothetical protein
MNFRCPFCGIYIPVTQDDFPLTCCGVRHESLEKVPNEVTPELRAQVQSALRSPHFYGLSRSEVNELFPDEEDQTLIGNQIKAITEWLGVPPCGGCENRRIWLNNAHSYLRKVKCKLLGGDCPPAG